MCRVLAVCPLAKSLQTLRGCHTGRCLPQGQLDRPRSPLGNQQQPRPGRSDVFRSPKQFVHRMLGSEVPASLPGRTVLPERPVRAGPEGEASSAPSRGHMLAGASHWRGPHHRSAGQPAGSRFCRNHGLGASSPPRFLLRWSSASHPLGWG